MTWLITVAMEMEARLLIERLAPAPTLDGRPSFAGELPGPAAGRRVCLLLTGMGQVNAAQATAAALERLAEVEAVLNLGCAGAYLAADRAVIDTLINRSRSFIFSTSLPPAIPAAALAALAIVQSAEGAELRRALEANRRTFAARLQQGGCDLLGSQTQIIPVLIGEPAATMAAAQRLLAGGVFIQGIRPPTVPAGRCRLRATLMAQHSEAELIRAADLVLASLPGAAA